MTSLSMESELGLFRHRLPLLFGSADEAVEFACKLGRRRQTVRIAVGSGVWRAYEGR